MAIRREVSSIISRLHRVDFGKTLDNLPPSMGGASAYMKELVDKLTFVRKEILSRYTLGDVTQEWSVFQSSASAQHTGNMVFVAGQP